MKKRWVSMLLVLAIMAGSGVGVTEVSGVSKTSIQALRTAFPDGKYWNHMGSTINNPDGWTNTPCTHHGDNCDYYGACGCNSFGGAIQCMGFARKLAAAYYGIESGDKYWPEIYDLNAIKAGDVVRYRVGSVEHSVWVYQRDADGMLTVAECNYPWEAGERQSCIIHWGRKLLNTNIDNLVYIHSAPYAVSDTPHTHTYVEGYEAAHPHKVYMMCSVCGESYYTGATRTLSTCTQCQALSSTSSLAAPATLSVTRSNSKEATVAWTAVSGATYYDVQFRRNGGGNYSTTDWKSDPDYRNGTSYISYEMLNLTYYFRVRAVNSSGASDWVEVAYPNASGVAYVEAAATSAHSHSLIHASAKAATETTEGNSEYWFCSSCGKYFSDSAATNEITLSDTVIPKLTHQHALTPYSAKAVTCTESGNRAYWYCEGCGKYFSSAAAITETTLAAVALDPLGHSYEDGVCVRCGEPDPEYVAPIAGEDVHFDKQTLYFQGQFTDVPTNQWFTSSVADAYEFGLMKGDSDTTFNPYGDVTLAEAITMAARIHSIYNTGTESFVQTGTWYQVYLDYAYQNGIISRAYYNADVTRKATRAQFATIFANALPDEALFAMNTIADNAIPDVSIRESFAPYVYKLYRAGILTGGDSLGTFSPGTYITRAEAAAIVSRMAESDNRKSFSLA